MSKLKSREKKAPKRILALPDLEHAKTAVLNSLTSVSGQRTYDHAIREFVAWYCSEPRLAFNRTVVRLGNWLTPEQGRRLLESAAPSSALSPYRLTSILAGCKR